MADIEEKLTKHRVAIEELVETVAERNPDYAERLRAQLDSVQPGLDDLQDMLRDASLGGEPMPGEPDEGEGGDEGDQKEGDQKEGEGD